jgi:hypothetical protein
MDKTMKSVRGTSVVCLITMGCVGFSVSEAGEAVSLPRLKISGPTVKAWWFNPRTGRATVIGESPAAGEREFTPPDRVRVVCGPLPSLLPA